jgi:EmrB/QacA subfamily drug resistance transporter
VTGAGTDDRRLTHDPRLWRVVIAAALGVFAIELDFFAVQAALPDMAHDLHTSVTNLQWVISGYMLANGATLIVGGRVGDILGRRRWLVIGMAAFGLASLAGGLAPNSSFLITMRLVQGVAAAFGFPLSLAVVTNAFPQVKVERAVGMVFGIAAVGQAFGPLIGGGLTAALGWRSVLLVNVPVSAAVIALAYSSIRESRDESIPRHIDWFGLGLIVVSISAFTYAVDRASDLGWTATSTLGLMIAGLLGIVVFVIVEGRVRFPLMDLSLFRIREFDLMTAAGTIGNIGTSTAIFTSMILLQQVKGLSALDAGLAFLGFSLGVAASSQISGRVERFPSWLVMAVSLLCGGLGAIAMGLVGGVVPFMLVAVFAGLGFGMSWAFTSVSTQAVVPPAKAGQASGVVLTIVVTMGGVAIALASTVVESANAGKNGLETALQGVLIGAGALAVLMSAVLVALGRRRPGPATVTPAAAEPAQA